MLALVLVGGVAVGLVAVGSPPAMTPQSPPGASPSSSAPPSPSPPRPDLAGPTVVVDPGHQLGNGRFPEQVNRLVRAGGFRKPCNTVGTATADGFPEATFTWEVSRLVRARLRELGARVVLTRSSNSADQWGPCVDARGRAGNRLGADLKLSIHADGSDAAGARGFHVIAPAAGDASREALRLARVVRSSLLAAGVPTASYIAGGDGLDRRRDLATLNLSAMPAVIVELGNMRSPRDAALMTSDEGRARYADALVAAVLSYLSAR